MAKITFCAAGADVSDQVFSFEHQDPEAISAFISLVRHGAKIAGFAKPAVTVESESHFQDISERNGWEFKSDQL